MSSLLRYAAANRLIERPALKLHIGGQPGKIDAVPMADVDRLVEFAEPLLARPSSPRLAAALEQLPKRGLWVLARENGQPFDHRVDLYLPVRTLYKRAAVVRTRSPLHGLRHTYGSVMAAAGVPLPVLKELMGHSKIETTMRYIDVNEGQKVLRLPRLSP
jgi:integrase